MKRIFSTAASAVLSFFKKVFRVIRRFSPSSVWASLGLARFVSVKQLALWALAAGVTIIIFLFSAQSGADSGELSMGVLEWLGRCFGFPTTQDAHIFIRKLAHFSVFALEALLFAAAVCSTKSLKRYGKGIILLTMLIVAAASEGVQILADSRGPSVKDVLIDYSGVIAGLLLYKAFEWLGNRNAERKHKMEMNAMHPKIFDRHTKWMCVSEFADKSPVNVFHREADKVTLKHDPSLMNYHMYARRSFRLGARARSAELLISADDYYKLYVNGTYVAQGPAAGYPSHYYVNRIDILKYLRSGENVIALDVYYQGLINRVWVSGDQRQGFICELWVDGNLIVKSDEHFHYMRSKSYATDNKFGYDTQFAENFDAREEPRGWKDVGFDDFLWASASANPNHDYTFCWQETPVLHTEVIKPAEMTIEDGRAYIDFGKEYSGVLLLEAEGGKGKNITILMGEELQADGKHVKHETRANCNYKEQLTLASGVTEWEMYDYRAFRYAELVLDDGVKLTDVSARIQFYPMREDACALETTDEDLKNIFELCKHTLKTGIQEAYLDCPTREKGQYSGDLAVTSLSHIYATGDTRLLKKALDDWTRSAFITDGLMAVFPSSLMQEIADYSLLYPLVALRYYRHSGDSAYLRECYACAEKMLRVFEKYARPDGLLETVSESWNLVDWPKNLRDDYDFKVDTPVAEGCHNVINAFYIGSVKYMEIIAKELGVERENRSERLAAAFNDAFFNMETNLYVDALGSSHSAVHSNILPLFFEIAPKEKVEFIADDLIRKGMRTGVYMAFFLLKALAKAGRYQAVYDLITDDGEHSWKNMLREGATTLYEAWGKDQKWNTSLCHPWASAPLSVLTEDLLGITPAVIEGGTWTPHLPESVKQLKYTVMVLGRRVIFERNEEGTFLNIEKAEQ